MRLPETSYKKPETSHWSLVTGLPALPAMPTLLAMLTLPAMPALLAMLRLLAIYWERLSRLGGWVVPIYRLSRLGGWVVPIFGGSISDRDVPKPVPHSRSEHSITAESFYIFCGAWVSRSSFLRAGCIEGTDIWINISYFPSRITCNAITRNQSRTKTSHWSLVTGLAALPAMPALLAMLTLLAKCWERLSRLGGWVVPIFAESISDRDVPKPIPR